MLRVLGNPKRLCDGLTRREVLQIGALGTLGFGLDLPTLLRLRQLQAATSGRSGSDSFGKAKACILLFPYGSPPQHETFDPKPQAPREIQGEMKAIATSVPGLEICEHLPKVARVMDRATVVRSMNHPYPLHCLAYATSGNPSYDVSLETNIRDPRHWPFVGSVVDYIQTRKSPGRYPPMPRNVGLPWLMNSQSDLGPLAGPYAAFLGQRHDPIWTSFDGKATKKAPKLSDNQAQQYLDPYSGVEPDCRFSLSAAGQGPPGITLDLLNERRTLLEQLESARQRVESSGPAQTFDRFQEMAFSLLTSRNLRDALDVRREMPRTRESYGMTLFGQSCLAARRLVEAGSQFVTVFWDAYKIFAGCCWDTHANHFPRLKEYLLPGFDRAYSGLILDLEARGMLDETLVLCMSEHGRTPRIDSKPKGAGRHHWSRVYSAVYAGGGIAQGRVVGSSDHLGGDVRDTPVSPKDILATTYHLLGIDPYTVITDDQDRPLPIAGAGRVRPELL